MIHEYVNLCLQFRRKKNVVKYGPGYLLGKVERCVKKHVGPICKVKASFTL